LQYREIKVPGEHLHSVFVDFTKKEPPNITRYIRNVRRTYEDPSSDESKSSKISNIEHESDKNPIVIEDIQNETQRFETITERIFSFNEFKSAVPKWGGSINYKNKIVTISDTCTIDYFLFAFWVMFKVNNDLIEGFKSYNNEQYDIIKDIIDKIENHNWNKAKELWIIKIMKYKISSSIKNISLFGSEDLMFFSYLSKYQEYQIVQKCQPTCINNNSIYRSSSTYIFFRKENNIPKLFFGYTEKCRFCSESITTDIIFINQTKFLFIQPSEMNIVFSELPREILVDDQRFKLLCATLHTELADGHFVGMFNFNNDIYIVDDLNQSVEILSRKSDYNKNNVSGTLYYLI
jgi:hypothetical protein